MTSRVEIKASSSLRTFNFHFKSKTETSTDYGFTTEIRLITGHRAKRQFSFCIQRESKGPKTPTKHDRNSRARARTTIDQPNSAAICCMPAVRWGPGDKAGAVMPPWHSWEENRMRKEGEAGAAVGPSHLLL